LILLLLYLLWSRVRAPLIHGFGGRYLYPFSPILLISLPTRKFAAPGLEATTWTAILG
jgi:hypothetical protein